MSKFFRGAALVAGAVALVVGTAGVLAPVATASALGSLGVTASATAIASAASAVAAAASLGAQLTAKRPTNERQGLQLSFKIEPGAPIRYPIGRTAVAGTVAHRETMGTDSHYETWFVIFGHAGGASTGVESIEDFTADRVSVPFSGTAATGYFASWMWQDRQLGASPEADALGHGVVSPPFGIIPPQVPGWSASHKLSGYAAASWTMLFDTKARRYANAEPAPAWVGKWAKAYDPRLDSSYPGGSGPHRWADPSDRAAHEAARATWTWTERPALHELKWALGIWDAAPGEPFKRVLGIGAPIDLIDVAAYVEAANIQEANGWTIGGEIDSAQDKWEVLKLIAEAGGCEPVPNGAKLSTMIKAPRVSVATITRDDLADGAIPVPSSRSRRERLNGWRPRFRSEAHGWEMVSTNLVQLAGALAQDGAPRTGSGDFALVQNANQAAQLAAYQVLDGRERTPIPIRLKPLWVQHRVGACLTTDLSEFGLVDQDMLLRGWDVDPMSGVVTLTFSTETADKHVLALGQTGTVEDVPETPDPQAGIPAPEAADWTLVASTDAVGIMFEGVVGNTNATQVVFSYRETGGDWMGAGSDDPEVMAKAVGGLAAGTDYEGGVQYVIRGQLSERLILGPVTTDDEVILDGNFF